MNSIYFSIIIPVYNSEQYLIECIDSVLHQNFKDFELILVDNGSNDDSGKIIDSYLYDKRIKKLSLNIIKEFLMQEIKELCLQMENI